MPLLRPLLTLALLALPIVAAPAQNSTQDQPPHNPILAGADPHMAVLGKDYWIYPTNAIDPGDGFAAEQFFAYQSPDLQHWTRHGPILRIGDIGWIDDDGAKAHYLWAPAIAAANGRYYLYYSVGPQNPTPSRIGVAVADSPTGPFVDSGQPLLTGGDGFEAIDPMVFTDPKSGISYLYAGGSAGSTLRVYELKPNMTQIDREIFVEQPPHFTEGSFMHERNGIYYLSYSSGHWNDATYSVHYATAPGPTGPWTYRGVILKSDATHKGPGHHAFVKNPSTGEWFIAYHRWERSDEKGPFNGTRQVAVQKISYNKKGLIQPIKMNDAPPPASPITDK